MRNTRKTWSMSINWSEIDPSRSYRYRTWNILTLQFYFCLLYKIVWEYSFGKFFFLFLILSVTIKKSHNDKFFLKIKKEISKKNPNPDPPHWFQLIKSLGLSVWWANNYKFFQEAIFWAEHIIRHNGGEHLKSKYVYFNSYI